MTLVGAETRMPIGICMIKDKLRRFQLGMYVTFWKKLFIFSIYSKTLQETEIKDWGLINVAEDISG